MHEPAMAGGHVEQGMPVDVRMEGKVVGFAQGEEWAATNPIVGPGQHMSGPPGGEK